MLEFGIIVATIATLLMIGIKVYEKLNPSK